MTHCERVLELLSDGEWHSHLELYALHVVAHSRVSDLRRRGHTIEQRRDGDLYLYRLAGGLGEGEGSTNGLPDGGGPGLSLAEPALASSPSPRGGLASLDGVRPPAAGPVEQLTLELGAAA